ncbi:hypothetical protein KC669_03905, partial [Candidatus Dojkabacteria bacterium]|nr:hypothetical protein [Candidatus Dojkabacteria bacterium]
ELYNNKITKDNITKDGISLSYNYNEENEIYEYSVYGETPTPCYSVEVTNNYNSELDSVTVTVFIHSEQQEDNLCAQVLTPFKKSGAVNGTRQTIFDLVIKNETIINNNIDSTNELKETSVSDGSANGLFKYEGNNVWKYSIEGYVPNGCASAAEDIQVDNESINYTITITTPNNTDIFCTQALEPYKFSGQVNAGASASISFKEVTADSPAY